MKKWHEVAEMIRRVLKEQMFWLLFFCGSFLLGVWGWSLDTNTFADAVYNTMQLVTLNANFDQTEKPINWALEFSRFILPLFAAGTIIVILLQAAHQRLTYLWIKFFPKEIIFLGVGRIASGIAANLLQGEKAKNKKILALDKNIERGQAQFLVCPGNVLLAGDATNTKILRRLNLAKAKDIYIFTGDDQQDLDIAAKVIGILSENKTKHPRLIIDIDDKSLLRVANQDSTFREYREKNEDGIIGEHKGDIVWFSAKSQAARMLFINHPPICYSTSKIKAPVHIGIVGFGALAQEIVLQAIRHCVYFDERPVAISIFAEDETEMDRFLLRHPALGFNQDDMAYGSLLPLADIRFYRCNPEAPSVSVLRQALVDHPNQPISKTYVTAKTDYFCLNASYRFVQALLAVQTTPDVVCCISGTQFINRAEVEAVKAEAAREASENKDQSIYEHIDLFHCITDLFCPREEYPGSVSDEIGILIDAAYNVFKRPGEKSMNLPENFEELLSDGITLAKRKWITSLSNVYRDSSRHSGDHAYVKLRELGFDLIPLEGDISSSNDEVVSSVAKQLEEEIEKNLEKLMRMEHRRYCKERLVDDWLYRKLSYKQMQLNETLVPYDQLDDEEAFKDKKIIRALPAILKTKTFIQHYRLVRQEQLHVDTGSGCVQNMQWSYVDTCR
ncbi:MAG: NAD-binding protein [Candidatus Gracilibacteria bacterium]|nr:NAD-binding protein [Candidatus Gracilibacteria bacterium]